jgi:hypothetical protein
MGKPARRKLIRKTVRRSVPRRKRTAKDPAAASLARSLKELQEGLKRVITSSGDVLRALEGLREDATRVYEERLAHALISRNILDDLMLLEAALAGGDFSAVDRQRFAAVPTAVLAWVAEFLHAEPNLAIGTERDIPPSSLDNYEWAEALGSVTGLVRARVTAPGWRWRKTLLARPKAVRVARGEP